MTDKREHLARVLANSLYQKCNEGVSYNTTFSKPKWGYMVSISAGPVFDSVQDVDVLKVASFIEESFTDPQFQHPLHYFGVWTDQETGKIHFDLSDQFANVEFAINAAKEAGQIAVWDVANKKEIRVDGLRTYYSIRTTKARSTEEAINNVQEQVFYESDPLCDLVLTLDELLKKLEGLRTPTGRFVCSNCNEEDQKGNYCSNCGERL